MLAGYRLCALALACSGPGARVVSFCLGARGPIFVACHLGLHCQLERYTRWQFFIPRMWLIAFWPFETWCEIKKNTEIGNVNCTLCVNVKANLSSEENENASLSGR